jgi:NAD(P)-dependent dehydrogenase (short-subunit alcohol dehydrogenase family)
MSTVAVRRRNEGATVQLDGKVAVVTGGGRGIGRGIVDRFVEEGASVAVLQRRTLESPWAQDARVLGISIDLADPAAIAGAVADVVQELGGIDIAVNNAGVMFERSVTDIRAADWQHMVAVNLQAPLFVAQAVAPEMRRRGGGSIINIGSIEGLVANPLHAAYCATKAGVHGMTRALAVDLGVDNIRCNAIAPGWIESDLSEDYLRSHGDPAAARSALEALHPLRRTGRPSDVGDLAVFLASERAGFLTGEVIVLDGGRTALLPSPR